MFYTVVAACGPSAEEKAAFRLNQVRSLLARNDTSLALLHLDSIPRLFPKAAYSVNAAKNLQREIYWELMRQKERELDGINARIDSLLHYFASVKTEYDRYTRYIPTRQVPEKRMSESYLSVEVDEKGSVTLTSHYFGSGRLNHTHVRVISDDREVSTGIVPPENSDSYRSSFMGSAWERVRYRDANEGGVTAFIASSKAVSVRLLFSGNRNYPVILTNADRQAFREAYGLASSLNQKRELEQTLVQIRNKI